VKERSVSVDMRMCTGGERQCKGCQSIQVSREEVQERGTRFHGIQQNDVVQVGHNAAQSGTVEFGGCEKESK